MSTLHKHMSYRFQYRVFFVSVQHVARGGGATPGVIARGVFVVFVVFVVFGTGESAALIPSILCTPLLVFCSCDRCGDGDGVSGEVGEGEEEEEEGIDGLNVV